MPEDKLQREIEDILNRLDNFVPEERVTSKVRRRSSDAATSFVRAVLAPLARISLRQVMLTALALTVLSFFFMRAEPDFARWMLIGGLILFFTSFALSFFTRSSPAKVETRYWRDRPIDVDQQPTLGDRLRAWWQTKFGQRR
jgi:hypothetical protein